MNYNWLSVMLSISATILYAELTKNPTIHYTKEPLGRLNYTLANHEKQFINFVGAYDIQIYQKNGLDDFKDFKSFNKIENTILSNRENISGCVFDQRRLLMKETVWIDVVTTDKNFYSDQILIKDKNFGLLLRNDFQIFVVTFDVDQHGALSSLSREDKPQSYLSFLDDTLKKNASRPQGFYDQLYGNVFIFTEIGGVQFSTKNGHKDLQFTKFQMQQRQTILKVQRNFNSVYVVTGKEGIDIYDKQGTTYVYKQTIELKHPVSNQTLNVLDIQFSMYDDTMYVLDKKVGIHIIRNVDGEIKVETIIPINNAIAFSSHKGSFLVAAQTNQKIGFALEILYDSTSHDFYYNKFYLDDLEIKDIFNFEDKSIMIGYDAQKLVYQNIYNGFTDQNFEWDSELQVANVENMELMTKLNQRHLFVLTKYQLKTYNIKEVPPMIICSSNVEVKQSFWVTINSTICKTKSTNDPFDLCALEFQYTLEVYKSLIDSEQAIPTIIIVSLIALFFVLVLCCGLCSCRRWSLLLDVMEKQKQQLTKKKYGQLQEQDQSGNV